MKTPILGSSYVARSVNAADSRMVNLFPEIVPEAGKEPAFLNRAPGIRQVYEVGVGPIRGLYQFNNVAYVISGPQLYSITLAGVVTPLGFVSGQGPVSMADNGTQLFIACNPDSYIWNAATKQFQQITDIDFPGAVTVCFLDGYFVFNPPNSQQIWITALYDGTNIDALDFASAEGSPDNIVALLADHREVWVFGTNSVEVWYNAGNIDFPLARIQGAYNEIGCVAPYSVAKMDNAIFWLGADARGRGIVYRSKGYAGERVSTHAVEWQIQRYDNLSDAVAYTYQQEGHSFYVLNFPAANTTWVFDASTGVWHERASWVDGYYARHRGNCQVSFSDEIWVGDYQNGKIYALDLYDYSDNGDVQRWSRSWRALPTGENNLRRTTHHSLQLDCETGVGLNGDDSFDVTAGLLLTEDNKFLITESGEYLQEQLETVQGANPQVMLRWSDDGGHTWSNEHWVSMGRIGRFGQRAIWRRLGMTQKIRDRVYEVAGTDPVKIAIVGAELILSPTNA
jgi:hypothetical protein